LSSIERNFPEGHVMRSIQRSTARISKSSNTYDEIRSSRIVVRVNDKVFRSIFR